MIDDFDDSTGAPIPEKLKAVFWCDGDNSQLDIIVGQEGLDFLVNSGVITNKHNAARTGGEQSCDQSKEFPIGKRLNKTITLQHIPSSQHLLKRNLETKFKDLYNENLMRLKKKNDTVNYLGKHSKNLHKSLCY